MDTSVKISASIVLYKDNIKTLQKTIDSFLKTSIPKKLYLIDNNTDNTLKNYFNAPEIEYTFIGRNVGFGKAHNTVLNKINSKFHLILNPDLDFNQEVIPRLIDKIETEKDCSFITPKVLYENGEYQFICRKYPAVFDLINRRLGISSRKNFENEYRNQDLTKPFYPDFIHGCFMLFKSEDFINLKGFDERFFLYMEDVDICKRIDLMNKKKLYFPEVEVIHQYQKGSSKKVKLFFYHLSSAIKYFLKWGL